MKNKTKKAAPKTKISGHHPIIDNILKNSKYLDAPSAWNEGYSAHSDGWIDYTDHSDYSDNSR